MQAFIGRLIFHIEKQSSSKEQFDEQVRIVFAENAEAACVKFNRIGEQESTCFQNRHQRTIHWKYICIRDMHALALLPDGATLYSETHEAEDAGSFIRYIQQKSFPLHKETPDPAAYHVST